MKHMFAMLFLAFTVTLAQSYQVVEATEFVVDQINHTSTSIYLAVPTLTSLTVADALRRAMVERGVSVYVITTAQGLSHEADATNSLALPGAQVFVGDVPEDYFLLILDKTTVLSGPLVAIEGDLEDQNMQTVSVTDATNAEQYAALLDQMMTEPNRYQFSLGGQ
jgi:glycerol-3-phosphate dehydrogenase